jgi:hypothetical protein
LPALKKNPGDTVYTRNCRKLQQLCGAMMDDQGLASQIRSISLGMSLQTGNREGKASRFEESGTDSDHPPPREGRVLGSRGGAELAKIIHSIKKIEREIRGSLPFEESWR